MLTFLKILGAVVIVILSLILIAWWWIKRRIMAAAEQYGDVIKLAQFMDTRPARLRLTRAESPDYDRDAKRLIVALDEIGFQRLADLCDHEGNLHARVASHRTLPVGAAVYKGFANGGEWTGFVVFSLNAGRCVVGRGQGPRERIELPRIDWQIEEQMPPEAALAAVTTRLGDKQLPIDLRTSRAILEQVYAVGMDRGLVNGPTVNTVRQLAERHDIELDAEQEASALEMLKDDWISKLQDAVLDRYRRTSKIDAATWEDMEDDIHVVHDSLGNDDIEALLVVDEAGEQLFAACVDQGLTGLALYRGIISRLPPDQQWVEFATVDRPLPSVLFKPSEEYSAETRGGGQFLYEALGPYNEPVHGSIVATGAGDAKRQLMDKGLRDPKIIVEPVPGSESSDDAFVDQTSARLAAELAGKSMLVATLRLVGTSWWVWLPPIPFVAMSIYDGAPFSIGDYVSFAWAVIALAAMIFLIGPSILYHNLLLARVKGQPNVATFFVRLLAATSFHNDMMKNQVRLERLKILAMRGRGDEAAQIWADTRGNMPEDEFLTGLDSIYDESGEFEKKIEVQRCLVKVAPAMHNASVDLAMSLARYTTETDEAEKLIGSISPDDLSEVAIMAYEYTHGLLAARNGHYKAALQRYASALQYAEPFVGMPLILAFTSEINGYIAVSLKKLGDLERAEDIWASVAPLLERHRSAANVIAEYQAA